MDKARGRAAGMAVVGGRELGKAWRRRRQAGRKTVEEYWLYPSSVSLVSRVEAQFILDGSQS